MKNRIFLFGLVFFIIGCNLALIALAGRWLVKDDHVEAADAMIILMGSFSDRLLQADDLYHQGIAGKIIIVEEGIGAFEELTARGIFLLNNSWETNNVLIELGVPADSIFLLPGHAKSTQMEAEVIRNYLGLNSSIDTVLLVSSAPHTRRAHMIFSAAFKAADLPVTILCSPSRYTKFNAGAWWKSREDIQDVLMEYLKIFNFVFFEKRKL